MLAVLSISISGLEFADAPGFVEAAISHVPTTFGKLVLLANMASPGRVKVAKPGIEAAVERKHQDTFTAWLALPLRDQTMEVADYFAGDAAGERVRIKQMVHAWTRETPWDKLIPETASCAERELFATNFGETLALLQRGLDPSESPLEG
jgi:hypothetical protein